MDVVRNVNGKLLRCGYTTGACAAAAARAAAVMLLTRAPVSAVCIRTPAGVTLSLDVLDIQKCGERMRCAVRKDAGDDPDVTDGALVYATVHRIARGVRINGGEGIGRVTLPGLDQPVGAAAINAVPRRMIAENLRAVCTETGYAGGLSAVISIPGGEALSMRTFNPRMGIVGGLSVLGTTGIVEPMSNAALIDTIRLTLRQAAAAGARAVLLTPGNYGARYARDTLRLAIPAHVNCANCIGDAVDASVETSFGQILLVGHVGKLVKLGIGVTNTHSAFGDGRMETLVACALAAGGSNALLKQLLQCVATDAALSLLCEAGILEKTMALLGRRIGQTLARRVPEGVIVDFVCFTNAAPFAGTLAQSAGAEAMMAQWRDRT